MLNQARAADSVDRKLRYLEPAQGVLQELEVGAP
jgi:hypothetical protein